MRSAAEIAREQNIELTKEQEDYLNRYMRLKRMRRVWADDPERDIRIEEIELVMKTFFHMDEATRFAFESEALKEKYGC